MTTTATGAPVILTADERELLRRTRRHICRCVADPAEGVAYLRASRISGGTDEFDYACGRTRIVGQWWRGGVVVRRVSITYPRLMAWCESLPVQTRTRARLLHRAHPDSTHHLPILDRLTLAALADPPHHPHRPPRRRSERPMTCRSVKGRSPS